MAADVIIRQLAASPLFQGLSRTQLDEIARRAEHVIYHPGAMIIEENAEGHAAILIVSGEAVRVSGPELKSRFEPIEAGSLLGEAAMLVETVYASTVVARGTVRGLQIRREELHAHMAEDPSIADAVVQNLAGRLLAISDELREVDALLACEDGELPPLPEPPAEQAVLPAPVH